MSWCWSSSCTASALNVCRFELISLAALSAPHRYDLGTEVAGQFLAVTRFDRNQSRKVHLEDFAQVFGLTPEHKYSES